MPRNLANAQILFSLRRISILKFIPTPPTNFSNKYSFGIPYNNGMNILGRISHTLQCIAVRIRDAREIRHDIYFLIKCSTEFEIFAGDGTHAQPSASHLYSNEVEWLLCSHNKTRLSCSLQLENGCICAYKISVSPTHLLFAKANKYKRFSQISKLCHLCQTYYTIT